MKTMPAQSDDGMESLYEDQSKGPSESVDQQEQEEMANQAVVPINVLQGKDGEPVKVGDEIVVKVTAMHGDSEATIIYAPKKKEEPGETPPNEMSPDDELESMGKEY